MSLFNILVHNKYSSLPNENPLAYRFVYNIAHSFVCLIFMFIGVCLYNYYKKNWTLNKLIVTVQMIYIFFVMAFLNGPNTALIKVYSVTYTFALLVFINFYLLEDKLKYNKILNFLGNISYPLYIVHGVNGYILLTILDGFKINPYICIIITISLSMLLAYLLHIFIEIPSSKLGKKIVRKIFSTAPDEKSIQTVA